jgi:hypothetical protein
MPPGNEQAMASPPGTTFGKREVHRVWSERGSIFICISPLRGLSVALVFLLLSAALGLVGFRSINAAPSGGLLVAIGLALLSFASLWWAVRTLRAVATQRPVLRLDPHRLVVHRASGDVVLHWEDISLAFGPIVLSIKARTADRAARQQTVEELSVAHLLLPGGSSGLKKAIASVRPGVLERSTA